MRKLIHPLFFIALAFAINSCKKHDATSNDIIVPYETGKTITTVVAGKVTDQTGTALNNVQITIGTTTVITDVNGSFIIPKATLGEKVGFIKAAKDGYFAGSRTIMPKEKVINNIVIQLVKKTQSGSFANASGGTITVATGGSIVFGANAISLKNGGAYTGTVKVAAYFLDPTSKDCYKEMPGDLRGINTSNNEQVLTSYGMMAVELQGSNGEALQLATGKTATVTFPIVAATQSKAPATIPLWFFDETKGMWVEQGTATKVGNNYVGTVSHFTWWNCDWGGGPLTLTATFVDQNGNPLSGYHVYYVTSAGWGGGGGHGMTASDGSLTGNIPANQTIIIKIESNNSCGGSYVTLYSNTIGSFTANANLGTITVNLSTANVVIIKGTVADCNNNPVVNGYAVINIGSDVFYTYIDSGKLNFSHTYCSAIAVTIATVGVFDLTTLKQNSTPITVSISGAGTFNIGQVAACGTQLFMYYTATFVDQNGNNLNNFYVSFVKDTTTVNTTSQTGNINTKLHTNISMIRKVYVYPKCGGIAILVDSTIVGPFTTNFNAGTISVNVIQPNTFTISGTVSDCNNNFVINGFATIIADGQTYNTSINNGIFIESITRCSNSTTTAIINVFDTINKQQNSLPISVSISNIDTNIGNVQACGLSTNQFVTYTFEGINYNGTDSLDAYKTSIGGRTHISSTIFFPNSTFSGDIGGITTGIYNITVSLKVNGVAYSSNASVSANITEYGLVGQYIAGSFSGNLFIFGTTSNPKLFTGSFRIKRSQ